MEMENKDFTQKMSDNDLVELVQKDANSEALIELSKRHSPLCYSIYQRYSSAITSSGHYFQDTVSDKDSTIYKACQSFKSDKNVKFSTWLGNHVNYQCLSILNKKNPCDSIEEENLKIKIEEEISGEDKNHDLANYFKHLINQLSDERIKTVFNLRYFDEDSNKSWSAIASKLGLSTQSAIDLHNKGTKILKQKLTSVENFDIV